METEYPFCSRCGQAIKNIIMIDGKPYGTECATTVLGINQLPSWFKGGDWNKAKIRHETEQANQVEKFSSMKDITDRNWSEWVKISKAEKRAYREGNDWAYKFISSCREQLGYFTCLASTKFATMKEAEEGWEPSSGSFPYLYHEPKSISELSPKQQSILNKFL